MKCELIIFDHAANGLSLFVVPETDAERVVLRGLWKHGELMRCNGIADDSGEGFCVAWKLEAKERA